MGDYANLNWPNFFFKKLLPVTIGNSIGGVVMVGMTYWFIFLRTNLVTHPAQASQPANDSQADGSPE